MRPQRGLVVALFLSLALAQSVREIGMGGVSLPGPGSAWQNPALAAVENRFDRGTFSLPLGLLGLLMPDRSPLYYFADPPTFYSSFDLLAFYDQLTHLDSFLLNPEKSPGEVVLKVESDVSGNPRFSLTDGAGHPIDLAAARGLAPSRPPGLIPPPVVSVPFSLGGGFSGSVGLFAGVDGLGLSPDAKLAALLAGGSLEPNQSYAVTGKGAASAGLSMGFAYALALPPLPDLEGTLYLGTRGEAFLGLARVDGEVTTTFTTDSSGKPAGSQTTSRVFYSAIGQGFGYGVRLDLGLAYANEVGVFGLGVQNLVSFAQWQGSERVDDGSGPVVRPKTETVAGLAPAVFASGAGYAPLEEGGKLLVAADLGYDGAFFGHLGVEYPLENLALRAGLGYDAGVKFGVGIGLDLAGFRLDLALTSHTAALFGGQVFGLAAAVGF